MKTTTKKTRKKEAFTIIELLTVMSIIVILLGLLVPAMNKAKIYARTVNQRNQFHSIDVALELFKIEYEDYPPSDQFDDDTPADEYCGAMKLAEALVGQDLLGFHPDSVFHADLRDASGILLYYLSGQPSIENLESRRGPYLTIDRANAYRLSNLFTAGQLSTSVLPDRFVLCDEFSRVTNMGDEGPSRIGTPVLYYKADISKFGNDSNEVIPNIYTYEDNSDLIDMGMPGSLISHLMSKSRFYSEIENPNINITYGRPYKPDSYILISAGPDGQYGTRDDIFNFEK